MSEEIKSKVKMFEVQDSSCTADKPERIHDIVMDGQVKRIKFTYGQPTKLPYAEAMKFQKDGFTVLDDKGVAVSRAPETPIETALKLGPDQVIANLSELSGEALYARSVSLQGGEKFKANSSKDAMIAFLTQAVKTKTAPSAPAPDDVPEMAEGSLDEMGLAAE